MRPQVLVDVAFSGLYKCLQHHEEMVCLEVRHIMFLQSIPSVKIKTNKNMKLIYRNRNKKNS